MLTVEIIIVNDVRVLTLKIVPNCFVYFRGAYEEWKRGDLGYFSRVVSAMTSEKSGNPSIKLTCYHTRHLLFIITIFVFSHSYTL